MAKYEWLIGKLSSKGGRVFLALMTAGFSFTVGLNWPEIRATLHHVVRQMEESSASHHILSAKDSGDDPSSVQPLITQPNPSLANASTALAAQPEIISVPKEFQGKIIANTALPKTSKKVIALTFDDGPWPETTEEVLDILKKNHIKATFFWIGKNLKNYPDLGKEVVAEGHAIGNHTWHHWYHQMNAATAAKEIEDTAALIYQITGVKTTLFRPPGGIINNGPASYAKQKNYTVMMWSADSKDWSYKMSPPEVVVNNVLKQAKPGGIILMHDGGGNRHKTVLALPQIIASLQKQGYQFVTVPELLEIQDRELKLAKSTSTPFNSHKFVKVAPKQKAASKNI